MGASKGSWGKTQEAMENQGSSTFLRLENDGDKAVVAFCGAPLPRDICFNEATKQYEAWDENHKTAGRRKQTKYAMNVFVVSALGKAVEEMRVIDMNFKTMTDVIALKDKYTLSKCTFEIRRHGAKGDTKTQYQILPDADITTEQRALFGYQDPKDPEGWIDGTLKLLDLEEAIAKAGDDEGTAVSNDLKGKPATAAADKKSKTNGTNGTTTAAAPAPAPAAAAAAPATTSGDTIAKAVATEIIEKLKPLDKDKGIVPFLAKFPYAKKVSEIRASDEAAARDLANRLAAPPAAEDPFA